MYLIGLLLPLTGNTGKPSSAKMLDAVANALTEGGMTA